MCVCVCLCTPRQNILNEISEIVHRRNKSFPLPGGLLTCCRRALLEGLVLLCVSLGQRDAGGRARLDVFLGLRQSTETSRWMKFMRRQMKNIMTKSSDSDEGGQFTPLCAFLPWS